MSDISGRWASGASARQWVIDAAALFLLLCGLAWFGYTVSLPARPSELASVEAMLGIRVERLKLAAGGYFLDFRYRVLDRAKASGLLHPGEATYLMLEKLPVRLTAIQVPPPGPAKISAPERGVNIALFGNPGQLVKRGDRVTLVLGRYKASGLTVQ